MGAGPGGAESKLGVVQNKQHALLKLSPCKPHCLLACCLELLCNPAGASYLPGGPLRLRCGCPLLPLAVLQPTGNHSHLFGGGCPLLASSLCLFANMQKVNSAVTPLFCGKMSCIISFFPASFFHTIFKIVADFFGPLEMLVHDYNAVTSLFCEKRCPITRGQQPITKIPGEVQCSHGTSLRKIASHSGLILGTLFAQRVSV